MKMLISLSLICLPLKRLEITSAFGYRVHPLTGKYCFHNGVDLRGRNDTIYAVTDGAVTGVGYDARLGLYAKLNHGWFQSAYGHLSQVFPEQGNTVYAGEPIGITGATGEATAEHLHFSIRYRNRYTDPLEFLKHLLILQQHE